MKKLFLTAAVALLAFTANAQDGMFKLGLSAGIPTGDFSDSYSFGLGLDAAYLFPVSDDFHVGGASGFVNIFGEDVETTFFGETVTFEVDDAQFIPLAAAARFMASENFYIGADLGYAISVGEGDGGFYYRPRVGYNFSEKIGANASYSGISADGATLSYFGVGVEFSL